MSERFADVNVMDRVAHGGGGVMVWDWFLDPPYPPNTVKLHILEWPFSVASLRHTCAIIMNV